MSEPVYVLLCDDHENEQMDILGVYSTRENAEKQSEICSKVDDPCGQVVYQIVERQLDKEVIIV